MILELCAQKRRTGPSITPEVPVAQNDSFIYLHAAAGCCCAGNSEAAAAAARQRRMAQAELLREASGIASRDHGLFQLCDLS